MSKNHLALPDTTPVDSEDKVDEIDGATASDKPELSVVEKPLTQQATSPKKWRASNLVHEGSDDWLFLVAGSNSVLDLYRTNSSFTARMGRKWVDLLKQRSSHFQAQGIQYLHLSAPEKLSVLHQHFLDKLDNIDGSPTMYMANNHAAEVPCFVNVVPFFRSQIDKTMLYWKTDTHWSCWGCYAAYQLLCGRMGVAARTDLLGYPFNEGPVLFDLGAKLETPRKEKARFYHFNKKSKRTFANPIVRFKEKHGLVDEPSLHVGSHVVFQNDSDDAIKKRIMLFGDSFSEYRTHLLTGMLAETFSEVHFIWNASIDHAYVESIKPDVVISELAERFMVRVPKDNLDIQQFAAERLAEFKALPKNANATFNEKPDLIQEELFSKETYELKKPITVQSACIDINNDESMTTNPVRLTVVEDAKVYFIGGRTQIRSSNGKAIVRHRVDDELNKMIEWQTHQKLPGTSLILGDSMGAHCYYHWMLDLLPKLGLVEKAGIDLSSIDNFLVRELNNSFHIDTLQRFGIDLSRVVQTKNNRYLDCDRVIHVHVNNGINLKMNRYIPAFMKHVYPPIHPVGDRIKLYISRPKGVRRGIANEDAMIPILRAAGYTITAMEGMTVQEQSQLLARADVLISPHGGALTNMIFCRPGIKVVELFGRHVYPFYYGLAQMCGHDYYPVLEDCSDYPRLIQFKTANEAGSAEIQKTTRNNHFEVDLKVLRDVLEAVA